MNESFDTTKQLDENNQIAKPLTVVYGPTSSDSKRDNATPISKERDLGLVIGSNTPTPYYKSIKTNIDYDKYAPYVGDTVVPSPMLDYSRAMRQTWGEEMANSLGRMVMSEVVAGTIETLGAIIEPQTVVRGLMDDSVEFDNALYQMGASLREWSDGAMPIYRKNPGAAWDVGDTAWWFENSISVASTLSMLIPAYGVRAAVGAAVKGAGRALSTSKILDAARKIEKMKIGATSVSKVPTTFRNKVSDFLLSPAMDTITTMTVMPTVMRHGENFRESAQLAESERDISLQETAAMSDSEFKDYADRIKASFPTVDTSSKQALAESIGGHAAAKAYKVNASNIVFDMIQVAPLIKAFGSTTFGLSKAGVKATNNASFINLGGIRPVSKRVLEARYAALNLPYTKGVEAGRVALRTGLFVGAAATEGAEEFINYVGQAEGKHLAKLIALNAEVDKNSTWVDRLTQEYAKDGHAWEQFLWGSVGGAVFQGAINAKQYLDESKYRKKSTNHQSTLTDARVNTYNEIKARYDMHKKAIESIMSEPDPTTGKYKDSRIQELADAGATKEEIDAFREDAVEAAYHDLGYLFGSRASGAVMEDLALEYVDFLLSGNETIFKKAEEKVKQKNQQTAPAPAPTQQEAAPEVAKVNPVSENLRKIVNEGFEKGAANQKKTLGTILAKATSKDVEGVIKQILLDTEEMSASTSYMTKKLEEKYKLKLAPYMEQKLTTAEGETVTMQEALEFSVLKLMDEILHSFSLGKNPALVNVISKKRVEYEARQKELEKNATALNTLLNMLPIGPRVLYVNALADQETVELFNIEAELINTKDNISEKEETRKVINKVVEKTPAVVAQQVWQTYIDNGGIIEDTTNSDSVLSFVKQKQASNQELANLPITIQDAIKAELESKLQTAKLLKARQNKKSDNAAETIRMMTVVSKTNQFTDPWYFTKNPDETAELERARGLDINRKNLVEAKAKLERLENLTPEQEVERKNTLVALDTLLQKTEAAIEEINNPTDRIIYQSLATIATILNSDEGNTTSGKERIIAELKKIAEAKKKLRADLTDVQALLEGYKLGTFHEGVMSILEQFSDVLSIIVKEMYNVDVTMPTLETRPTSRLQLRALSQRFTKAVKEQPDGHMELSDEEIINYILALEKLSPGTKLIASRVRLKNGEIVVQVSHNGTVLAQMFDNAHMTAQQIATENILNDQTILSLISTSEFWAGITKILNLQNKPDEKNKKLEAALKANIEILAIEQSLSDTQKSEILARFKKILDLYNTNLYLSIKNLKDVVLFNVQPAQVKDLDLFAVRNNLENYVERQKNDIKADETINQRLDASTNNQIEIMMTSASPGILVKPKEKAGKKRFFNVMDVAVVKRDETNEKLSEEDAIANAVFRAESAKGGQILENVANPTKFDRLKTGDKDEGSSFYIMLDGLAGTKFPAKLRLNTFSDLKGVANAEGKKFLAAQFDIAFKAILQDINATSDGSELTFSDTTKNTLIISGNFIHFKEGLLYVPIMTNSALTAKDFEKFTLTDIKANPSKFKEALKKTLVNVNAKSLQEIKVYLKSGALVADFSYINVGTSGKRSNFGLMRSSSNNTDRDTSGMFSINYNAAEMSTPAERLYLHPALNLYFNNKNQAFIRTNSLLDLIYTHLDMYDDELDSDDLAERTQNITMAVIRGNIVHNVFNAVFDSYWNKQKGVRTGRIYPEAEVKAIIEQAKKELMQSPVKRRDNMSAELQAMLEANIETIAESAKLAADAVYVDLIDSRLDKIKVVRFEKKVSGHIHGTNVAGSMDLEIIFTDGNREVIDFKSKSTSSSNSIKAEMDGVGNDKDTADFVDRTADQLRIYSALSPIAGTTKLIMIPIYVEKTGTMSYNKGENKYDLGNRTSRLDRLSELPKDLKEEILRKLISNGLDTKYLPLVELAVERAQNLEINMGQQADDTKGDVINVRLKSLTQYTENDGTLDRDLRNVVHELIHIVDIKGNVSQSKLLELTELLNKVKPFSETTNTVAQAKLLGLIKQSATVSQFLEKLTNEGYTTGTILDIATEGNPELLAAFTETLKGAAKELSKTGLNQDLISILMFLYNPAAMGSENKSAVNEFVAYGLSNQPFAKFLNNITVTDVNPETGKDRKLTIWDKLLEILESIFDTLGITLNQKSALAEMVRILNAEVNNQPVTTEPIVTIPVPEPTNIVDTIMEEIEDLAGMDIEYTATGFEDFITGLDDTHKKLKASYFANKVEIDARLTPNESIDSLPTLPPIAKMDDLIDSKIKTGEIKFETEDTREQCLATGGHLGFTPGSAWEIVKEFKGKSHAKGGIDINIANGAINLTNSSGAVLAKEGLVFPNIIII